MYKFGENGVYKTQIRNAKRVVEAVMWDLYFCHKEPFANYLYVPQWSADYDKIAAWLTDNDGRGLLLAGGVGNGKTMMIRSVIPYIIRSCYGLVIHYSTAVQLASDEEKKRRKRFEVVLDAVDDLGTEDIRTYYGQVEIPFAMILDEVDQKGGLIIASTNMSIESLKAKYGERTYDRMLKSLKFVSFTGDSLRSHPLRVDKLDFTQQKNYNERLDEWLAWRSLVDDEVGQRLRDQQWKKRENLWRWERAKECGLTLEEWVRTKTTDEHYLRELWMKDKEKGGLPDFTCWLGSHGLPLGTNVEEKVAQVMKNVYKVKNTRGESPIDWFDFKKPGRHIIDAASLVSVN